MLWLRSLSYLASVWALGPWAFVCSPGLFPVPPRYLLCGAAAMGLVRARYLCDESKVEGYNLPDGPRSYSEHHHMGNVWCPRDAAHLTLFQARSHWRSLWRGIASLR